MRILAEAASSPIDVSERTVSICGSWYCKLNYDTLISSAVAVFLTLLIGLAVRRRLQSGRPGKLQMVLEWLLAYIKDLVRDNVGTKAAEEAMPVALPVAATIAIYIFIANWLDLFPLTKPLKPANADINQTAAMAIVVFVVVEWYSFRVLGFTGFLRKFTKPFELPLLARIGFIPLNIIEELAKPLTLSLRLFGNIFGGLLVVQLLGALFTIGSGFLHALIGPVAVAFLVGWKAFDVFLIGTLQAYIFMLLTIIYFGMAREGLEEEHGGHAAHVREAG